MSPVLLPLGVFLMILSVGLTAAYFLLRPKTKTRQTAPMPGSVKRLGARFSKAERVRTGVAFLVALIFFLITGWAPALILLPLGALTIPTLFSNRAERQVMEKLEALEAWTRSLSGLIGVGTFLETALKASQTSAAESIRPMVKRLIARLDGGWTLSAALEAFANEVDDPTADVIIMNLMLAAKQRGAGLGAALENIAESVHDEIRARHQIDTDRSKTRQDTRIIVVGVAVMLVGMPFLPVIAEPYQSATGQVMYMVWVGALCAVLYSMHQMTKPYRAARMLGRKAK